MDVRNGFIFGTALSAVFLSTPAAEAGKKAKCADCETIIESHPSTISPVPSSQPGATPGAPGAMPPAVAGAPAPQDSSAMPDVFASNYDVASTSDSLAPAMLGDVGPTNPTTLGGFTRFKIADGQSPLPQCRVSLLYNYFNDVGPNGPANRVYGYDIHRMGVAIEQCFMDSTFSLGIRSFVDNVQDSEFLGNTQFWDAGNTLVTLKALVYRGESLALSTGMGYNAATNSNGAGIPRTGSVQPFIGYLYNVSDRLFVQGFFECDIATHAGNGTFLWVDSAIGYRAYQNPGALLSAVVPMVEIHGNFPLNNITGIYNPVQTFTFPNAAPVTVGAVSQDVVNVTSALVLRFVDNIDFQTGIVAPISSDRQFTTEAIAQLHVRY